MVSPAEKASLLGSKFDSSSVVSVTHSFVLFPLSLGAILWPSKFCTPASASLS